MTPMAARWAADAVPAGGRESPSAEAFLDAMLVSYAGEARTAVIAVPAPAVALPTAFALFDSSPAFLWEPAVGPGHAAFGQTRVVRPLGENRGAQARGIVDRVSARLEAVYHPAVPPVAPKWFGGLAFAPGAADADPWRGFGDGCFVLPRWCYGRDGERAWLSLAIDGESLSVEERARASSELNALLAGLREGAERGSSPPGELTAPARIEHLPRGIWDAQVDAIRHAIEAGRVDKVVAARRAMVEAAGPIECSVVLTHLGRRYPGCTRFAARMGDATFVGATPERLVLRNGRQVLTEALAGSVHHGGAAALLASEKDRREHDLVVRILLERLAPYCRRLERSPDPQVKDLPNVAHLHTPVQGELAERTHVLELVDALHPTPAVGGVPVGAAVEWITTCESSARGWYSGPVGWFDAQGDGEFVVALRSGLVRGRQAWAYAGAGIVHGSEPRAEYAETALKLRPLLEALGDATSPSGEETG